MESSLDSPVPIATAAPVVPEEEAARIMQKRYEGLVMMRSKAVKGKGAWYWAHLEPIMYHNSETGLPRAVKLRCSLCHAEFSASNPSRTASEHLKRGTCPNFTSSAPPAAIAAAQSPPSSSSPRPISSLAPPVHNHHNRKRSSPLQGTPSYAVMPLAVVDYASPRHRQQEHFVLSGGKEDLEALAMLEDSVKKIKSPNASPYVALGRAQAESAMTNFADWIYESCGAVSLSSLDHPKFRAFLRQVGLPAFPCGELIGSRLTARYEEVLRESDARIHEALFFQIASDGWKPAGSNGVVTLTLNLPNGTSVFHKAVFVDRKVPARFAEGILWETVTELCGGELRRCAGIVSSKFKLKALGEIEKRNQWMVNFPCQLQSVSSLVKDFVLELPLFRGVVGKCKNIAHFFGTSPKANSCLQEYTLREQLNQVKLLPASFDSSSTGGVPVTGDYLTVITLLEDVMAHARELHQIVIDEAGSRFNDSFPAEIVKAILDPNFWNELEAALSLVNLTREMAQEIEAERPFVGQCLPMWDELRLKVKDWCARYKIGEGPVNEVIEKRFKKNYHPAWSAAFVLDPLYLMKDSSGKYLPPFKCLTPEQVEDVDSLISRLVSPEEAHIALMELLKWRSEGLDRDYALAVQIKQRDPATGKMKIANPLSSRLVWESHLREFKSLGKVAVRLIFLHATACGFKYNLSFLRWVGGQRLSTIRLERAQKMVFIAANEKLKRRDFSNEEEKDAQLFGSRDNGTSEDDFMETAPL